MTSGDPLNLFLVVSESGRWCFVLTKYCEVAHDMFAVLDEDGDGGLSFRELRAGMSTLHKRGFVAWSSPLVSCTKALQTPYCNSIENQ